MEKYKEQHLSNASVDFAKLQAGSESLLGDGTIRGLASKTAEYAEGHPSCRESNGGESKEQDNVSGTTLGRGNNAYDLEVTNKVAP